ncbi:TetR/AcrR family transcriptional regulator [Phytohabitans flavus]|uniref:TetR/AcrR family transcriptional regulator n=1 Tax=Phytohabitans flavus TaxID=1076124 RepID=UPI0018D65B68|nr:TetR/AcrR family transcriptional regulator [Phytohabitans flavus]
MSGSRSSVMGRPRGFDIDEALERAMRVFWEQGYEGSSLADLTGAMGITKTSMYAAFGNKEQLFRKVLQRYANGPAGYFDDALEQPTARSAVEALLRGSVRTSTLPVGFAGCLTIQGALPACDENRPAHDALVQFRNEAVERLELRFGRAVEEGDLPGDADPRRLARYVMALAFGIPVHAANGLGRAELDEIVDQVMMSWPGVS